jgi:hypothetical protein
VLSTKAVSIRAEDREIGFEAVMASVVSVLILGSLAVAALVWCFLGFTHAMKEPPGFTGFLFRFHQDRRNMRKGKATILEFPSFPPNHMIAAERKRHEKVRANE